MHEGAERPLRGLWAGAAGALLAGVIWGLVGPWDISAIGPDGRYIPDSESVGAIRIFAVLAVVDAVVAVGWWRGRVSAAAPAIGAGACWAVVGFIVISSARGSGANIGAGLWLVFGPAIAAGNALTAFVVTEVVQSVRGRRQGDG
jgi:hypothetical protein